MNEQEIRAEEIVIYNKLMDDYNELIDDYNNLIVKNDDLVDQLY